MKRSAKQTMAVAAWALMGSGLAFAADQPTAVPRIGVINIERLGTETALGKQFGEQLTKVQNEMRVEGAKREAALAKLDERLMQSRDQFAKDQATLTPEASEQRQQAISRLTREREAYRLESEDVLGALQRKVEREQQRLNGRMEEMLQSIVEAVTAERSLDLVLDRRMCLAVSAAIDITEDVIKRTDALPAGAVAPARPTPKTAKPPAK
jgi:Skp family chaperone for outer membrane proteins